MTFNELAEYINKCVTGNTLTLVMEDSVNETVIPLFMKSGVSISVSNAIVSVNTDFITVTGALSLAPLNGGALFHCVMRFEIRSGKFWLSINLTTEETVGLDKLFGGLNPIVASAEGEVQAVNGVLDGLSVIKPQIYVDSDTVSRELPFTLEASVSFKGNNTLWSQYAAWPKLMTVMTASFTLFYPGAGSGQDRVRFSARIPIVSGALPNGFFNGIVKSGSLAITLDSPVKSILDAGDYMMVGLMCEVNLKNMNTPIAVSSPLFRGDGIWFFETAFLDGLSIADTAKFITGLFGVEGGLELPAFAVLDNFRLYTLQFTFWGDAPYPNHTLVNIATSSPWKLPIPFVTIDMVRIEWGIIREGNIYTGSGKKFAMTADIFMKITIEITKNLKLKMSAQAQLPSFDIEGSLQLTSEDDPVRLMDLFGTDAGNALGKENAKSTLAQLDVFASPRNKNLSVTSTLNDVLSFDIGNVTLTVETVRAALTLASAGNAFEVFGDINFALEPNAFTIGIGGGYSQGSWHFYGELTSGQINIYTLLLAFLGVDYRGERGGIIITAFKLSYDTKGEFLIEAAFQDDFGLKIGNIAVGLGGFIAVRRANAETSVSAMLFLSVGMFQISVQADDFHDQLKLIFQVSLGNKALRATYAETTREATLHKEISVELVNTSLGDIVVMLINVINPNHRYELPSPFSVLNRIDLSRLRLVYDLTDESVCFTYRADLNVAGLMYLESVGLKYAKAPGEATKSLRFIIKAKPLTETDTKEYSWDAIKGAPPDIANKPIFKLHYMGVGQNVGNESLLKADTITQAIDALKQGFKEDTVFFDSRIHWLFGLDFTINGTINAKLVFNDPMLYGILITVEPNHSALEAFGGLSLELLYKKITNDIGMFNATLTLPTKFRKLNFGAVSVTIGTLSASIYTNGDFLIDLGFPHNDDFSRSFYVEVAQFTGCGGVYFGKLSGATAVGLPVTNRGVFNTVVKLGVGLAFGIGRTFDFGIVSGGLLLQVVGIFEGIFADFKPHGGGKGEMYYSVQATVGIIGRIYLSVDLKILVIRASVELKAFAKVTLTAHRPGLIHLSVSLTMSASIKILFIKINFSFKFSRTFRFEIGSGSPAPWSSVPHLEKTYINLDHFKAESLGRVTKIHLMFVPLLSIPDSVNDTDSYTCLKYGHASAETANSGADTIYCAAFIPTVSLTDYALFYNMLLDWTLLAWNTEIDRDSARNLTFDTVHAIVDYDRLREFFGINLKISLNSDVSYGGINESSDFDGAILPVPPPIRLTFIMPGEDGDSQNDLTVLDVNYDADNLVTSEYAEEIAKYFESLDPNPESASSGAKSNETGINEQATVIEEAPLAQIVFLDYAHMVLREIIGRLHSCFNEFSLDSAEVLVCERLSGVSLSRVICDNPDLPLVPMDTSIKNCRYTVLENDTVTTIAAKLCVTADSLFDEMKDLAGIVMMGTQFTLNAMIYSNSRNTMSVKQAGAFFFSRRHEFALTGYYPQITEKILLDNPQITLDFEETLNDANTIKLPDGKIWYTHVGDTPERIAKMAALTVLAPGTLPEWDVYLAAFISANGGDGDKTPLNITVPSETLAVIGDNTLSALLRRVCPATKGELYTANILKAYARIEVTRCVAIKDGDTIETLIKSSGAAVDDIAVALLENQAAIKPGKTLVLKNVPKLSKALVKSTLCTDAVSVDRLQ